jgi:hypothetical protein
MSPAPKCFAAGSPHALIKLATNFLAAIYLAPTVTWWL